jgi:hypothetical protein
MLSAKQLKDVCLCNDTGNKKCRFLGTDENNSNKFYCLKLTQRAVEINQEVDEFIKHCRKKGKDPYSENVPLGNNCQGYPLLRDIEQGYDKKNS